MSDFDKQLITEFLAENFERFQLFLAENEIDETEAENIIDNLKFA